MQVMPAGRDNGRQEVEGNGGSPGQKEVVRERGVGVFDKIARQAGAGTIVYITGFANAVVSPALEFKQEGFVLGTAAEMFSIAGPVLVYGVTTSVLYGLILFVFHLY